MSMFDTIQTTLRAAVTTMAQSGWEYRRMTSTLSAETRTWGAFASLVVMPVPSMAGPVTYDEDTDSTDRTERMSIRVPDTQQALTIGDQVKSPAGIYWSIDGRESGGDAAGSVRYALTRRIPLKAAPGRGGP